MGFVEYVQRGLESARLTRYGLAKRLGRSVTLMSRALNPENPVGASEELLREVAEALNLDGDRLVALSAEVYEQGSPRWVSSTRLGEILRLKAENAELRARLGASRDGGEAA